MQPNKQKIDMAKKMPKVNLTIKKPVKYDITINKPMKVNPRGKYV